MFYTTDIFYTFILICIAQGTYFVSVNRSFWGGDKECVFDNPPSIGFTDKSIRVQIHDLNTSEDENIWAGYFKKKSGFEYTGCISSIGFDTWRTSGEISKSNPGSCYSLCGNSLIIGVTKHECYCLKNQRPATMTHPHCKSKCNSPDEFACGGTADEVQYISVYQFNLNVTDENDLKVNNSYQGNCLSIDPKQKQYYWRQCSGKESELSKMCVKDRKVWANQSIHNNWWNTVNSCLNNNSTPIDFSNSKRVPVDTGGQFWTGIIRSNVWYNTKDKNIPEKKDIEYGYFQKKEKNVYELKFEKDGTEKRRHLCFKGEAADDTFSQATKSAEATPSSDITPTKQQKADGQGSDTSVHIGVSVAAVLIIVAIIITVVILKRRGKILNICCVGASSQKSADNTKTIYTGNNEVIHTSDASADDQIGELESQKKADVNEDDSLDNSNYADTYSFLEEQVKESDTEYDECAYGNNYSKMENDADYNTLNIHSKRVDDTYDTAEKAAMKLKSANGKSNKFGDSGEETYNHINSNQLKITKTDNIYGGPSNNENTYGVCRNDLHVEKAEYSHINNIKKESSIPDNHRTTS